MPTFTSLALGGGALLGGVAGAMGSSSEEYSGIDRNNMIDPGLLESQQLDALPGNFAFANSMLDAGPNAIDIAGNAKQTGLDYASMLGAASATGYRPTASDIGFGNVVAGNLFQNQRVQLGQSFEDQATEARRLSAQLGRPVNDPILQAKLRTGFLRQQAQLNARQGEMAQSLALQQPRDRLSLKAQQADVLNQLSQQAFSNRLNLLTMGSGILQNERNWRLQLAPKFGRTEGGGGLGGALTGALAGAGVGGSVGSMFGGLGGGTSFTDNFNRALSSTPLPDASNFSLLSNPAPSFPQVSSFPMGPNQFVAPGAFSGMGPIPQTGPARYF